MRWVLLLAVVAMAGCVEPGDDDDIVDQGRTVIAEDQYYTSGFELNRNAVLTVAVEVLSGPNIDVMLVDELNFQQFKDGNAFVHFESCGGIAAQGFSRTCSLPVDTYMVILDNTDAGLTAPPIDGVNNGADASWTISLA